MTLGSIVVKFGWIVKFVPWYWANRTTGVYCNLNILSNYIPNGQFRKTAVFGYTFSSETTFAKRVHFTVFFSGFVN